jgi:hypothetical protein
MDGRRRAGVGGQNCDGALLMARPLSGHAHPVRRQRAPPQAMVDRSEPRHISQLHCGSDHDLGRHAGDPHGQTTTWGRYTPILTVALRRRASSPCLKVGTQAPQAPWRTVKNRAFECLLRGFWAGEWITSGDPNAQCNSAVTLDERGLSVSLITTRNRIGYEVPARGTCVSDVSRVDPSDSSSLAPIHSLYTPSRTAPQPVHTTVPPPP